MVVVVDFDGTIVEHKYPAIGDPVPNALNVLKRLQDHKHKLILWTMRSGEKLEEAVTYLRENGILLYGINKNPAQFTWTDSPKAFGNAYIDDAAVGCPLIHVKTPGVRPFVAWGAVEDWLERRGFFDGRLSQ